MRNILSVLLVVFVSATCVADNGLSIAAQHEINRRGPAVERVSAGYEASGQSLLLEAIKPPDSDAHKWFVTLITSPNCEPCERLKRDFASAPELRAWANPADHKDSFTHFNIVSVADATQGWRYHKVSGKATPAIVIQPPLNGAWGDPRNCLEPIEGYGGNPAQLAVTIRQRIADYIEQLDAGTLPLTQLAKRPNNRDLPFPPVFSPPTVVNQQPPQTINDNPLANVVSNLERFFFKGSNPMFSMGTAAVIGVFALLCIREFRKETGKKLIVSDDAANQLGKVVNIDNATIVALVSAVVAAMNQNKTPTPPAP
jgi:hypothetical protein